MTIPALYRRIAKEDMAIPVDDLPKNRAKALAEERFHQKLIASGFNDIASHTMIYYRKG